MYVAVKHPDDLHHLGDRRNILVRLRMNNCSWCVSSQPDWDTMVKKAKPLLAPQDAIAEVESEFVDEFKDFVEKNRGEPLPPFRGYPTVIIITRRGMNLHEERDTDSYMKLLEKIQSIPKERKSKEKTPKRVPKPTKTKKSKPDPRLQLIEYEGGVRNRILKKVRRKTRHAK